MKKFVALLLMFSISLVLISCSVSWTDKEVKNARTVEITCYDRDVHKEAVRHIISDEKTVKRLCNTFTLLVVKRFKTTEPIEIAYSVAFLDERGEIIEDVGVLAGCNVVQNEGKCYKITDDMDLNRYIKEDILQEFE